jgi:hypothetical protein
MADAQSSLTFVLDENSGSLPGLLRAMRALAHDRVTTLEQLGIPACTLDPAVLRGLGERGGCALVTRDGRMLEPVAQREAWRAAHVTLFLLGGRWGSLPLGEMTRRFVFLWPAIVAHANASAFGAAWRVNPSLPEAPARAFRLVTGRHAGSPNGQAGLADT